MKPVYLKVLFCIVLNSWVYALFAQNTTNHRIVPDKLDREIAYNQQQHNFKALARNYRAKADKTESVKVRAVYLEKALEAEQKYKKAEETIELNSQLASCYTQLNEYDNALKYQFRLLLYYKQKGDKLHIAQAHSGIASLYDDKSDMPKAYEHYRIALQMARELKSEVGEAAILNNLAGLYRKTDSIAKAFESVRYAMLLNRKSENDYWLSINYMTMADIFSKLEQHDSVAFYLEKADEYTRDKGDETDRITMMRKWGVYHYHSGNPERALKLFNSGILLSRKIGSLEAESNFMHWISEVYTNTGRSELAIAYLQLHYDLLDSLRKEQNTELVESLNIVYNVGQIQDSLQIALLEGNIAKQASERKNSQLMIIVAIVILLLILLVYVVIHYRKKEATNKLLLKLQLSGSGNKTKYAGSNLSDETRNRILEQFVALVVDQELFRENDLTISQVAEKLEIGRTYLSQVINEHFGLSFNAYINDCRLELAKRYLEDRSYDKYSINGIAEMVGFKSLSAFNSGFKKATGLTPSYYRNNS